MELDAWNGIGLLVGLTLSGLFLRKRGRWLLGLFRVWAGRRWPLFSRLVYGLTLLFWLGAWLAIDDQRRAELQTWLMETAPGGSYLATLLPQPPIEAEKSVLPAR